MSLATQLGTYTKLSPKQKATMLAILHAPCLLWPTGLVWMCGAYAASDNTRAKLTSIGPGHARLAIDI